MSDQTTGGEPSEASLPLSDAPLVGEEAVAAEPAGKGWKSPLRLGSLVIAAVLVVAAAVVVPLKLTAARSVTGALGGVFSQQTVRFTITGSGPATQGQLTGDSIVVTLAGKNGASVADGPGSVDIEALLAGSRSLFDLRATPAGVFFRLDPGALSALPPSANAPSPARLRARLTALARRRPALSFLDQVAAGKWVGVSEGAIKSSLRQLRQRLAAIAPGQKKVDPKAAHKLVQQVGTAFGQTWDELVSLHKVGQSDGATEYSVDLPLRSFVEGILHRLAKEPTSGVPGLGRLLKGALSSNLHIPALSVPIDLWIAGGSLVKIAVTHSGATVTAAIDHPAAPTSPSGVSYISAGQLRRLFAMAFGSGASFGSISGPAGVVPPTGQLPDMHVITALTFVQMSYAKAHSFSELFNSSSKVSLYKLVPSKLHLFRWKPDGLSSSPAEISVHVGGGGSYVVIANYSPGRQVCEGILFVPRASGTPVLGAVRKSGGEYAFNEKVSGSGCSAAGITSVPAKPLSGWTGYAPLSGSSNASSAWSGTSSNN